MHIQTSTHDGTDVVPAHAKPCGFSVTRTSATRTAPIGTVDITMHELFIEYDETFRFEMDEARELVARLVQQIAALESGL